MKKYSSFGLGFPKSFLVKAGANPAFYVALDSIIQPGDHAAEMLFRGNSPQPVPLTRGALMERLIKDYLAAGNRLLNSAFNNRIESGISPDGTALFMAEALSAMVRAHFVSFCVPFDSNTADADLENYYMEREWRLLGGVRFQLNDICRIVLPQRYAKRFRQDVPNYRGEITLAK